MKTRLRLAALAAGSSLIALCAGAANAQSLTEAGTIGAYTGQSQMLEIGDDGFITGGSPSNSSSGFAISPDGSVLVGDSVHPSGRGHGFSYTIAGGMIDLGALYSGGRSVATGVSENGAVITGFADTGNGTYHAVRWANGQITDIGTLVNNNGGYSFASAISYDGSVIVGATYTNNTIDRAFRWTQAGGMVDLGLISGSGYSDAYGVSGDGKWVVGASGTASGFRHAFAWAEGQGMSDLGTIGNASVNSTARAANADGSVIVGFSGIGTGIAKHAFIWVRGGSMTDLGTIGNVQGDSFALAVNGPGTIVVGTSAAGTGALAFVWTQQQGMQALNALLEAAGVNMNGVLLTRASGISRTGEFIGGTGTFNGTTRAFLARLTPSGGGGPGGVTTPESVLQSINDLARSWVAQMVTQTLLDSLLIGRNEQVKCATTCVGGFGSLGSMSIGVHGRHSLTKDLTVLAGVAYTETENPGLKVTGAWSFAGSLRYDFSFLGSARPYLEVGGQMTPNSTVTHTRSYVNGGGVATGVGVSSNSNYGLFARVGGVARLSKKDELAGSLSVSRGWQHIGGWDEELSADNPFPSHAGAGRVTQNVANASLQYTRLLVPRLEGNLNVGASRSFGSKNSVDVAVDGAGTARAGLAEHTWYEYGARLGYWVRRGLTIDAFALGVLGPHGHSEAHGGIGVRIVM